MLAKNVDGSGRLNVNAAISDIKNTSSDAQTQRDTALRSAQQLTNPDDRAAFLKALDQQGIWPDKATLEAYAKQFYGGDMAKAEAAYLKASQGAPEPGFGDYMRQVGGMFKAGGEGIADVGKALWQQGHETCSSNGSRKRTTRAAGASRISKTSLDMPRLWARKRF